MKMKNKEAIEAYKQHEAKIKERLARINELAGNHKKTFLSDKSAKNWGYVADIGQVEKWLKDIECFLSEIK